MTDGLFHCPRWPRCGCPDGAVASDCPGLSANAIPRTVAELTQRSQALAAAEAAAEAAAGLLRFARTGNREEIDPDTLLDAAKLAMEVGGWPADAGEQGQANAAVAKFLEF